MDYTKFYELDREPFRNDPDERFYFESSAHRRAHLRLIRAVHQHKGLSALIGGPGCGKTTLSHHLFQLLEPDKFAAHQISIGHSDCAQGWLLPHLASAFGVESPAKGAAALLDQLQARFVELISESRFPVLLVDEAQMLRSTGVMEEFRGLLNLTHAGRKVISIVLFGLPELADVLRLDEPLAQRVEVRYELTQLTRDEATEYVRHRLTVAGGSDDVFTDDAIEAIWTYSRGVPRLINTLCDNTLFEGFLGQARPVDGSLVAEAGEQLGLNEADAEGDTPDWMESVVPPAETDFERAVALDATAAPAPEPAAFDDADDDIAMGETQIAAEPLVKLDDDVELGATTQGDGEGDEEDGSVMLKSDAKPKLEEGDFSMGSIIREMNAEDDDEDDDAPELELGADDDEDAAEPEPEPVLEAAVGDDLAAELDGLADLEMDGDVSQVIGEVSDDDLDLELGEDDDAEDELELALEDEAEDDEDGFEIRLKSDSDSGVELDAADAADADDDDSGEFDPSLMLADDDEEDEAPPATMIVPLADVAKAAAESEEEDDDLDSLFEDIQVAD